jgi:mandelate racemase
MYRNGRDAPIPAVRRTAVETARRKGHSIAPLDDFRTGRSGLKLIGLKGVSMIAVSGLDMAAWDALAKTANLPLAVFLGGAPVPAYNNNGLWLTPVDELGEQAMALLAEGEFQGLKLRLGRERLADDIAAIRAVPRFAAPTIC